MKESSSTPSPCNRVLNAKSSSTGKVKRKYNKISKSRGSLTPACDCKKRKNENILPDNLADFIIENEAATPVLTEEQYDECLEILCSKISRRKQLVLIHRILGNYCIYALTMRTAWKEIVLKWILCYMFVFSNDPLKLMQIFEKSYYPNLRRANKLRILCLVLLIISKTCELTVLWSWRNQARKDHIRRIKSHVWNLIVRFHKPSLGEFQFYSGLVQPQKSLRMKCFQFYL